MAGLEAVKMEEPFVDGATLPTYGFFFGKNPQLSKTRWFGLSFTRAFSTVLAGKSDEGDGPMRNVKNGLVVKQVVPAAPDCGRGKFHAVAAGGMAPEKLSIISKLSAFF